MCHVSLEYHIPSQAPLLALLQQHRALAIEKPIEAIHQRADGYSNKATGIKLSSVGMLMQSWNATG